MKKIIRRIVPYTLLTTAAIIIFQCTTKKENDRSNATQENAAKTVSLERESFNYIFESGKEGYTCYRIPAIVVTNEGTLLAFAEGRKKGCSDTGDIDLLVKRSEDGGKTWSAATLIWSDGENVCGNPAPVVDRETGDIFLLSTWNLGIDHEKEILAGTSEDTRRVFVLSSSDDGKNWSDARDITKSVKRDNWAWYATGPVSGIQLQHSKYKGRLVIPCDFIEPGRTKAGSHIIYSDDHGKSWQLGGIAPHDQVNESTVAELASGALMLNMRNYDRDENARKVAVSRDGGNSWSAVSSDKTLIEPICQGSLISHQFPGDDQHYLLFSNPAHEDKRINMTVRLSPDNGKTWTIAKTIHKGPSAYSNLVSLPNGDIGLYYEGGVKRPYEGLAFKIISAEEINIVE